MPSNQTRTPKPRPRSQRKRTLRLPEEMLAKHAERFPDTFDRHSVVALFALRTLAQKINDYTNDILAKFGLNAAKFNYLMVLYMRADDGVTLSELSQFIHTSNASVTTMVALLERDGLVGRRPHMVDGRSSVVSLTAKGRQLLEKSAPVQHGHWRAALKDLTVAERSQLGELIIRAGMGFDRYFLEDLTKGGPKATVRVSKQPNAKK